LYNADISYDFSHGWVQPIRYFWPLVVAIFLWKLLDLFPLALMTEYLYIEYTIQEKSNCRKTWFTNFASKWTGYIRYTCFDSVTFFFLTLTGLRKCAFLASNWTALQIFVEKQFVGFIIYSSLKDYTRMNTGFIYINNYW